MGRVRLAFVGALLLGVIAGSPSGAAGYCGWLTDPAGDPRLSTGLPQSPPVDDAAIDLVGAELATVGSRLVLELKVRDLSVPPDTSPGGVEYSAEFDFGGKRLEIVAWDRTTNGRGGGVGRRVEGRPTTPSFPVRVRFDESTDTISMSVSIAVLRELAGDETATEITNPRAVSWRYSGVEGPSQIPFEASNSLPADEMITGSPTPYVVGQPSCLDSR